MNPVSRVKNLTESMYWYFNDVDEDGLSPAESKRIADQHNWWDYYRGGRLPVDLAFASGIFLFKYLTGKPSGSTVKLWIFKTGN